MELFIGSMIGVTLTTLANQLFAPQHHECPAESPASSSSIYAAWYLQILIF